ncbi:unnamed protein product [Heterobilharzia americana]|nr:unnamed protein product [Heterobilharzia americana]
MFVRGLKSYGITSFLIPKISDHLLLKVFNYNNDHCYFRQYSTKIIQCDVKNSTEQSTDKVSSYPKYLSWTNSNELAHYLSQRVVAITEHFVVIDKPPNLSVWGHSLAKREVYSTIDPKLACTSSISINDCLQQLSNILASQEEKQLKQVSSNDSKNSVNAVEIPKLYIIEALPASYSGLILLGRNEKYTIAARQFYKSAMLGDVPWTLYQKFLIVCWGKPHEIQSKVISFPIAAYQLPGGIHVGYRPSPGEISVGLKRKGTILQKRLQHTTISEGCAVVGETFQIIMFRFCTFKIALKLDNGKSNYKHRPLLHLKGAMFYIEEWSMLLFIGKPSIMKAKSMVELGLHLQDLNMYDRSAETVVQGDSMSEELLLLLKKQKKESKELTKTARRLDGQRRKTFDLLIQCLPREVAKQIRQGMLPSETIKTYDSVTICFTKVVNFSNYCNRMCAQEIVGVLNRMYTLYDSMTGSYNVYKVETVNDSYMLVSGAPSPSPFHSAHIIEIALDILESTKQNLFWPSEAISKDLTKTQHEENVPLQLCIGCHTGSIVAGIVGFKSPRFCLFGDTVNTASRMMSAGLPDTVHVSSTLAENLSNYPYILESRGEQMIKGKGKMFTYFVRGRKTNFTTIDTVTGEELDFKKLLQEDIRINNQEIDESDDFDSEIHLDNNENDTSSVTISEMSSIADDLEYFPEIQELNLNKTNNFTDHLNTSNKNYVDVNHNEAFYEHEIQSEEMNLVQRKQNQPDLKLIYNMEYPDVLKDTENQSASDLTFTSSRSILFENLANPLTLGVTQVGIVQPENPLKYLGAWLYKYAENSTKENS